MPSLVGLQRRLLDPQLGLLGAQLGLLSPQFGLRCPQLGLLHVVWRLVLRWRMVLPTGLRVGLCAGLLLAVARDLASARQLLAGELAVLFAQFTRWLAVEVETLGGLAQRNQVSGAAGVASEECRQRRLAEHPWRALCDVGLDAQLQGFGLAAEQRREMLLEQISAGRRAHVLGPARRLGRFGLGCGDAGLGDLGDLASRRCIGRGCGDLLCCDRLGAVRGDMR